MMQIATFLSEELSWHHMTKVSEFSVNCFGEDQQVATLDCLSLI